MLCSRGESRVLWDGGDPALRLSLNALLATGRGGRGRL